MSFFKTIVNKLFSISRLRFDKSNYDEQLDKQNILNRHNVLAKEESDFKKTGVFQEVIETFKNTPINTIFSRSEIIDLVTTKYKERNPTSIIPSDYCYNRLNNGINYEKYLHLFEYTVDKNYRYLGPNYPYSGKIFHKPRGSFEVVVGELKNGVLISYDSEEVHNIKTTEKKTINEYIHKTKREIPLGLRYKIMKRDDFKCCICGSSPAKDPSIELHIDHIIPWSKGGETVENNLQTLCSKCNLGKSNKL